MKATVIAAAMALVLAPAFTAGTALAQKVTTDDVKWINQCLQDNKYEGAKQEVVLKYCTCMNNKMDNNETRSITHWEKANPREQAACSREAGWK